MWVRWLAGASKEDKEAALKAEQDANATASPAALSNGKSVTSGAAVKPTNGAKPANDAAMPPKAAV